MKVYGLGIAAAALILAGCGDSATPDDRGYTKAPTEDPGFTIEAEEPSPMAELGAPNQPRPEEIEMAPDTTAAP